MHGKCALLAAVLIVFAAAGFAGDGESSSFYPSRPITIIVPFAKGGGLDVSVRLLAKYAEIELGQNIDVVNNTKGGNITGNMEGIAAPPDGYTLLAWGTGLVTDELVVRNAPYTRKDVLPLCLFADDPEVIVAAGDFAAENGIENLDDFFRHVRARPGAVTMGMGGNWSAHDFLRLKIEDQAGVKFNRMPFLGGAPALEAAAAGNCDAALPVVPEILGLKKRDGAAPLAVAHGTRVKSLPDIPSVAELGYPHMTQSVWRVLTLPKETPSWIARRLEEAFRRAMLGREFRDEAAALGINPVFMNAADLAAFLEREYAFYLEKTTEWGIRVDRSR